MKILRTRDTGDIVELKHRQWIVTEIVEQEITKVRFETPHIIVLQNENLQVDNPDSGYVLIFETNHDANDVYRALCNGEIVNIDKLKCPFNYKINYRIYPLAMWLKFIWRYPDAKDVIKDVDRLLRILDKIDKRYHTKG